MFGEHEDQDKLIELVVDEIKFIADSDNIKFYYGESSAIFTFKSNDNISDINELFNIIFSDSNIIYIILPFSNDKMSVKLPNGIYEHLFDINNSETLSGFTSKVQESLDKFNNLTNDLEFINLSDYDDDEDDEDGYELLKIKNKKREPTIDDILDKISENGLESLLDNELKILKKYSEII